jgi:hypothetical protein
VEQDRRRVVGEHAVALTRLQERIAHHDVREERQRSVRPARRAEQRPKQRRIVEQGVDALVVQLGLGAVAILGAALRDQGEGERRILARQARTNVGSDHAVFLRWRRTL